MSVKYEAGLGPHVGGEISQINQDWKLKKSCCSSLLIAWVLWAETTSTAGSYWTPINRFELRSQCQNSLKKKLNSWHGRKNVNIGTNVVHLRNKNIAITYSCLPGNVDPGPRRTE